ncbi:hypothetical protein E5D57_010575 [Metarhizium anisopliae]|nr:hypothetical protein E5D57_010575 [Metarhizium anisopliae]
MKLTAIIASAAIPSVAYANIGVDWKFPNAPKTALKDLTFPINMANAKHEEGYFFAQQFKINGATRGAYTGLQPRPDKNGQSIVRAVFSSFEAGTTTTHSNCRDKADGGPGVSCTLEIPGDYANTYDLTIEYVSGTTWRGNLTDTVTRKSDEIGIWTMPVKTGNIQAKSGGFVEYFPWNRNLKQGPDCSKSVKTEATFYDPKSKTGGAGVLEKPYDYGHCKGKADFKQTKVQGGYTVNYGIN